jgi:hypothetical protein
VEQTISTSTEVARRKEAALRDQSCLVVQPLQSHNTNPAPLPGENRRVTTWHEESAPCDQSYLNIQPPYGSAQGTSSIPRFRPRPTHTLECALQSDTIGVPETWPAWPGMVPSPPREEYRSEGEILTGAPDDRGRNSLLSGLHPILIPVSQFSMLAGALDEEVVS